MQQFDVIVVGAGMVGASAALALARKGLSVALIERQAFSTELWQETDEFDLRVSAISPSSQQLLARLGIWTEIEKQRSCDYHKMCVWHENGAAQMNFSCEQAGATHLGTIVENRLIQSSLHRHLAMLNNVTLFAEQELESLQQTAQNITVVTAAGEQVVGQLLIAADGRESSVRKLSRLPATGGSYQQTAIVANVTTEFSHEHTAWQRFLATGPLAFLPLPNGQSSIVWSADTDRAQELLQLSDEEFMQQLSKAIEYRLGTVSAIGARAGFPLGWHMAGRWLDGRLLLIGDAAHGVHPLAGQGVNLGFDDVTLLSRTISTEQGIYNHRALRRFERQRKAETATAMHLFSALKLFYAQKNPLLCLSRDFGMSMVEKNLLIKRLVINSAMHNMA